MPFFVGMPGSGDGGSVPEETIDKVNSLDTKLASLETKVNKQNVNQSPTPPTVKEGLWIDTSK